jgi:ABC-type metal ion transport system, periplasmic component/surface adhesin
MKQIKYIFAAILVLLTSGCFRNDTMEDITIYTTAYPIEYVVTRLYGEHSTIKSIFPNGSIQGEVVSDKLLQDYSSTDLFIFNGLGVNEQDYVYKMLEYNKKLKIIDVTSSIVYHNKVEELWLDPMNLLTISNNIQKGFNEYIDSTYLTNDIAEEYATLKQDLIKLDADYREMAGRANRSTLVVSNDMFLYLEKYNITVISLEENDNLTQKNIHTVIEMVKNGDIKYIYTVKGSEVNNTIKNIQKQTNIELIELHDLYKLTEEEFNKEENYFTLMRNNLELLKNQLYD